MWNPNRSRHGPLFLFSTLMILIFTTLPAFGQHTIYFEENWEGGVGLWSASNGVWEVGSPTHGTTGTSWFPGYSCAATNLDGNYPYNTDSRLESVAITLPAPETLADGVLWLGFWHWFSNQASYGVDYSSVQIWTASDGWQEVSLHFVRESSVWTPYYVDITEYAGNTIKLGFFMNDEQSSGPSYQGAGWYVDEITIFDGAYTELGQITTFEEEDDRDWSGWYADRGIWERGAPASGISASFSGSNCFGTVLDGQYPYVAYSRLISPYFTLPANPLDGRVYLSFKQYCSLSGSYGTDKGYVEIHDGVDWVLLQTQSWLNNLGSQWSERIIDVSAYAGERVRIGFVIDDNQISGPAYQSHGWYIDDVRFSEGARYVGNPERFENFSPCLETAYGVWEVGEPTSGPNAAHSGTRCWGTNLDGNYLYGVDDLLSTPSITLGNGPGLFLSFWHWYSFSGSYGVDNGVVKIKPEGGTWTDINTFTGASDWTRYTYDLTAFAGQTVQFGFQLDDVQLSGPSSQSSGWYVDDFEIVGMPQQEAPPEPFYLDVTINAGPAELFFPHFAADKVIIYGSPVEDFQPTLGNRIAVLAGDALTYSDTLRPGWSSILYYRVSIVDALGNESTPVADSAPTAAPTYDAIAGPFVFESVSPNPFNPTTFINFTLTQPTWVDLNVFNLAGRKVADVLHARLEAGSYQVPFKPRYLASGTYFARIEAGPQIHTAKMVLLK